MTDKRGPAVLLDDLERIGSWLWKFRDGKTFSPGAMSANPTIDAGYRGGIWWDEGGTGEADELVSVRKNAGDTVEYATIPTVAGGATGVANLFNVRDYGAVGDGTTNDATAIAAAITAATASKGTVYAPPGTYFLTAAITVPEGVTLMGAGMLTTVLKRGLDTTATLITAAADHAGIRDLTIDGNRTVMTGHTDGFEIGTTSTDNLLERVRVINANALGVALIGTRPRMLSCEIVGSDTAGIGTIGVWAGSGNGDQLGIHNSTIRGWNVNGVYIEGGSNHRVTGCLFSRNHAQTSPTGGGQIDLASAGDCLISGNTFYGRGHTATADGGIEVSDSVVAITGNTVINHGNVGISFVSGASAVVSGNYVADNTTAGINIDTNNTGEMVIIGNISTDRQTPKTQGYGVKINAGCNNYVVIGNDLRGNDTASLLDSASGSVRELSGNLPADANTFSNAATVMDFPENTGMKIALFGDNDYGFGVEGSELRLASAGVVGFRTGSDYSGTESLVVTTTGLSLIDGVTAPATVAGKAQIYADTADGALKVKFGDGIVGTLAHNAGGIGYSTGAGGAVTQDTSITTTVVLNTVCGTITTVTDPAIAAGAEVAFTVTNSTVAATDTVILSMKTQFTDGNVIPVVKSTAAGSFVISLTNVDAAAVSLGAAAINFAVIKAVAA
jgi:hypothetical protein